MSLAGIHKYGKHNKLDTGFRRYDYICWRKIMKVLSSWSGGKDSCLACYTALNQGHNVVGLVNFVSREYNRSCFHGIPADLMKLQASSMALPLYIERTSPDMALYEQEFKAAVTRLKNELGIEGMVFGDIYLDEHRDWVERVCNDIGIIPLEPLWNRPVDEILNEFIAVGFKAVIVSAQEKVFDNTFVGRTIDVSLS